LPRGKPATCFARKPACRCCASAWANRKAACASPSLTAQPSERRRRSRRRSGSPGPAALASSPTPLPPRPTTPHGPVYREGSTPARCWTRGRRRCAPPWPCCRRPWHRAPWKSSGRWAASEVSARLEQLACPQG
jgi:hypothetical protein